MTAVLAGANVLVGLVVADYGHHEPPTEAWLADEANGFATWPVTEEAIVWLLVRESPPASAVTDLLAAIRDDPRHVFWADDVSYREVPLRGVVGHRQVTDAFLAELARRHSGLLATFDAGMTRLHADVARLVPTASH